MTDGTTPIAAKSYPIRAVRVEVLEGPDAGANAEVVANPVNIGTADGNDLPLSDETVSRYHVQIERDGRVIRVRDHGSTNGTRVGQVTFRSAEVEVRPGAVMTLGQTRLRLSDGDVRLVEPGLERFGRIRSSASPMKRVMVRAQKAATTQLGVLLEGESGVGKELMARAIHDASPRRDGPFVILDCGSSTPELFASELFGYVRGAFTGAEHDRMGAIQRADGGTLFLDELAELPPHAQKALLGVLGRRVVRPLGAVADIPVDIRLLAATHRVMREEVNQGRFRLDLYHRIAGAVLTIPPLRQRAVDFEMLIGELLEEEDVQDAASAIFSEDELEEMRTWRWPGNVRELRNYIIGTLALGQPPSRESADMDLAAVIGSLGTRPYRDAKRTVTTAFERSYLEALLDRTEGNVRKASREAKMDRSYLIELIRKHGLQ